MASGVEMLGQMSETEALAGPVSGGNMVVKPNEVPVGGAAMLAKALRKQSDKGIGGIYELPSQQEPTPEFMQMAQQNVKNDMTRMARTVESAAPPNHLMAYITPEEAGILKMLGGSGELNPITGIPQYPPQTSQQAQNTFNAPSGASANQSMSDKRDREQRQEAYQSMADAGISSLSGTTTDDAAGRRAEQDQRDAGFTPVSDAAQQSNQQDTEDLNKVKEDKDKQQNKVNNIQKDLDKAKAEGDIAAIENLTADLQKETSFLDKILENIARTESLSAQDSTFSEMLSSGKDKTLEKLKELGIIGPEIKDLKDLPKETYDEMTRLLGDFKRLDVSPKEAMSYFGTTLKSMKDGEFRDDEDGKDTDKLTLEGLTKRLRALDTDGGASVLESLKKYDPQAYFKAFGAPQTSGGLEDFAMSPLAKGDKLTKEQQRYNNAIFAAREATQDKRSRNDPFRRPGVMQDTMVEEVVETPDGVIDEEAQTMKYTSPRTGDKEIDVPLQRRFRTDPTQDVAQYRTAPRTEADILKYMTEGTTGEGIGLEPFSEYQRRRRKAMGLDPLELYG